MSDEDIFAEEMSGVKPLGREARVRLIKDRLSADQQKGRQLAAVGEEATLNPLVDDGVMPLDAWHVLEFKRPGIQNGVYRKLRLGHYQIDARLDLHRLAVTQARDEVFSFIEEATSLGLRTLLIVHGKGQSKAQGDCTAVLKGYVDHWLRELEAVQAFHSAQAAHGWDRCGLCVAAKKRRPKTRKSAQISKGTGSGLIVQLFEQ